MEKQNNTMRFIMMMPFLSSAFSLLHNRVLISIIALSMIVVLVAINPTCRQRESLWLFVMVAVSSIPLNLHFGRVFTLIGSDLFGYTKWESYIVGTVGYCIAFCAEEIIYGIVGRMIWRRQYKIRWDVGGRHG